ncbi:TetR/AcrR family transcriptional regulator [bacterium]|nr:TetR/AcrR family transcriptional regulator [bacterium]NBX71979.1 TetR/AcrR family transcriptional regulator [bacterium]
MLTNLDWSTKMKKFYFTGCYKQMTKKNDKKARLIQAAYQLFREKSYHATTLAMIAEQAEVPLGNVYYYFKSKEALLHAVLDRLTHNLQKLIININEKPTQKERIKEFIQYISDNAIELSDFGDPIVSLAKDLRDYPDIHCKITEAMQNICKWFNQQFLGLATNPQLQAHSLLQRLYGVIALATTLKSPQYITEHCDLIIAEL